MNAYAHPRTHRERRVCPYVRARIAARSSPPRTSKMVCRDTKGEQKTNKGENNAGRRPHTTEVRHNTQKSTQTKTKHTQRAHVASWIQVCYIPCYATQRTRDKNGNHANKSKRGPRGVTETCPPPTRTPAYVGGERERKGTKGMPPHANK